MIWFPLESGNRFESCISVAVNASELSGEVTQNIRLILLYIGGNRDATQPLSERKELSLNSVSTQRKAGKARTSTTVV